MSTGLALIAGVAASVAVFKLLTSRRGYVVLPGIRFSWGR